MSAIRELPLQIQNHISLLEKQLSDLLANKVKLTETSKIKNIDNEEEKVDYNKQENFEDELQEAYDDDVFETAVDQLDIDEINEEVQDSESNEKSMKNSDEELDDKEPSGRPVYPLTPLPRPIILPGGRKWRGPKDAYNEKFIAETLISQAEVLVGSTLG